MLQEYCVEIKNIRKNRRCIVLNQIVKQVHEEKQINVKHMVAVQDVLNQIVKQVPYGYKTCNHLMYLLFNKLEYKSASSFLFIKTTFTYACITYF